MMYPSEYVSDPRLFDPRLHSYTPIPTSSTSGATPIGGLLGGYTPPYLTNEHSVRVEVGKIVDKGYWIKATGSRVTKSGWTNESDWDYVIFDPDMKLEGELMKDSWELGGSGDKGDLIGRAFSSLKKDKTNFILVSQEDQWKKWIVATNLLKALDPKTKKERIELFATVFGNTPDSRAMDFGAPF